ncbi:MAG: hypothetical protein KAY32_07155 [Candidatus Eisenbacteria sp.]|nr:hypothetical protein [Candidatus Eisenbacteria bacterium]
MKRIISLFSPSTKPRTGGLILAALLAAVLAGALGTSFLVAPPTASASVKNAAPAADASYPLGQDFALTEGRAESDGGRRGDDGWQGPHALHMELIENWPFGQCEAVAVDSLNHTAWLASGGGVYAIDLMDPFFPEKTSEAVHTIGYATDLVFSDIDPWGGWSPLLYVLDGPRGLEIWDVHDPAHPARIGRCEMPGFGHALAIVDRYAYVAADTAGLVVIDLADLDEPSVVTTRETQDRAYGLAAEAGFVYVADYWGGMRIFDIGNPRDPVEIGAFPNALHAHDVAVRGGTAYIADDWMGLYVVDVTDPATPDSIGHCDPTGYANDIALRGSYAYVADGYTGLTLIDITDPTMPFVAGNCPDIGHATAVCRWSHWALVASTWSGLQFVSVEDPLHPECFASFPAPGFARAVDVQGDYVYVADEYAGLRVLQANLMSYPASIREIGSCPTMGAALDVDVSGNYVYVADWSGDLGIYFVIDPSNPHEAVHLELPGQAAGVRAFTEALPRTVYVACWDGGLAIVNANSPLTPYVLGSCETPGDARQVEIEGTYAFIADSWGGLTIVDITNPAHPFVETNLPLEGGGAAMDVDLEGGLAYVAGDTGGFYVIDISDPTAPWLVERFDTEGIAAGIDVTGERAYLADWGEGLRVLHLGMDPIQEIGFYDTPGAALNALVEGGAILVADNTTGVQVLVDTWPSGWDEGSRGEDWAPRSPLCLTVSPNLITTGVLSLRFGTRAPVSSGFDLIGVDGRAVRLLAPRVWPVGSYEVPLSLGAVPAGLYWLRATAGRADPARVLVVH